MAPEIKNSVEYDEQSDIYSLGIILFELLTKIPTNHQRIRLI